jgi:DNA processing protein
VVVLGSGLDVPYPGEHRSFFEKVARAGGAVISELPMGTRPSRGTFPRRNRLIAAMGEALVVVQAGARSGALLTAEMARKLGRPVLAVPGPVDRVPSAGAHQLLREGALVCEGPADVLKALGIAMEKAKAPPPAEPGAGTEEGKILAALGGGPLPFDELAAHAGLEVMRAAEVLLSMELAGLVQMARGHYRKV